MNTSSEKSNNVSVNQLPSDRLRELEERICKVEMVFLDYKIKFDEMFNRFNYMFNYGTNMPSNVQFSNGYMSKSKNDIISILTEQDKDQFDIEYSAEFPQVSLIMPNGRSYYNIALIEVDTLQKILNDIASLKDIVKREVIKTHAQKIGDRDLIIENSNGGVD